MKRTKKRRRRQQGNVLILGSLAGLLAIAIVALVGYMVYDEFFRDNSTLKSMATTSHANGQYDKAIAQMMDYLTKEPGDNEARRHLAVWYAEQGQTVKAARRLKEYEVIPPDDARVVLSTVRRRQLIMDSPGQIQLSLSDIVMPNSTVQISVTGKNLFSGHYQQGNLRNGDNPDLHTTEWFPVDPSGKQLVMSGGFNRANWQFRSINGNITTSGAEERYRRTDTNAVNNQIISVVDIPSDAVECRVFYADNRDTDTASLDERLQIEYGCFPSDYQPYRHEIYTFDHLSADQTVTYSAGEWNVSPVEGTPFHLDRGDTVALEADVFPVVRIDYTEDVPVTDGIYGVTWDVEDPSIILERTDDAVGLRFNYMNGSGMVGLGENDFDNIYPWSGIRLCAIDKNGVVKYSDEEDFRVDGGSGNVFVEIPVHYVKREVRDGREYIAISGTPRDGFILDPSFETPSGETLEHIYIAAYPSAIRDGTAYSISGAIPENGMSLVEYRDCIAQVGDGYSEIDICALMTLQRLFLVETAIRNTTALWAGVSFRAYFESNPEASYQYAIETAMNSNEISIVSNKLTARFRVGDAVAICNYDQWQGQTRYDTSCDRIILDISERDGKRVIQFDGEPIDIIEGEVQISCVPAVTGEMDTLMYHSGCIGINDGLSPFRYRFIENLWANGMEYVDGITTYNSIMTIQYPNGNVCELNYVLPVQQSRPMDGLPIDYSVVNISAMGFDEENPLIAMPITTGTSGSSYFGDMLYTSYSENWQEKTYTFVYGGAWDVRQSSGLFCYRCIASKTDHHRENISRMMYKENQ